MINSCEMMKGSLSSSSGTSASSTSATSGSNVDRGGGGSNLLHKKRSIRAPRIGQLPRHSAFDDGDQQVNNQELEILSKNGIISNHVINHAKPHPNTAFPVLSNDAQGSNHLHSKSSSIMSTGSPAGQHNKQHNSSSNHSSTNNNNIGKMEGVGVMGSKADPAHFTSAMEDLKNLSLNEKEEERRRSPKKATPSDSSRVSTPSGGACSTPGSGGSSESLVLMNPGSKVPLPAKCSSQLRKLIHSHSLSQPPQVLANPPVGGVDGADGGSGAGVGGEGGEIRPIFPNLPYSPYGSPSNSPRVKRKPLRETSRVNSITEPTGEFVQLNQYKLNEAIGQGSYGIVKLAYNKEDNSRYAMKILNKKKLKRKAGFFGGRRGMPNRKPNAPQRKITEDPINKVYREIAIMKKLDHPNVVKLVEVLDDPEDENLYMVFELLEGGELIEIPNDNPMDEKAAWLAFRDVILGLEYLHYQKIIHRDIKPSNLLRNPDGLVKVADLGVSNEFHGNDAFLTNTAGTPAFTPPESLAHKPGDDPYSGRAADIWSLGVTLYSLVVGQVPFLDDNILALYNKIRTQPFSFPANRDVSPELSDLIHKMLIKDPNERITLPEIKTHDWVTGFGVFPLATEEENCSELLEVTETEVEDCVRTVPKLDTLILVKSMIKNHSFINPFVTSLRTRFRNNGRSNSAPEVTFIDDSDDEDEKFVVD